MDAATFLSVEFESHHGVENDQFATYGDVSA